MKKDMDSVLPGRGYNKEQPVQAEKGMIVYVTVGVPFSNIPIMQKVMLYVDELVDTPITAAKKLRKQVADNIECHGWVKGTRFTPAELYYEIYGAVDNNIPFAASSNSRKLNGPYSIVVGKET